ncbi:hypothetical protein OSB04_un000759 [Centaurea solstitialis]|uniref:Leucine-rich repeat-containing N-terminal plant-type domain-containing protein n=1 Tax=Centaurea solstitialis TaxID=347529 RepID=A0AA38W3A2_9ASTR|nr:hypothetical protein OSB04_un000759 [Centaurea solstitialis]
MGLKKRQRHLVHSSARINYTGQYQRVIECFNKERQTLLHFKASLRGHSEQLSTWRVEDACCKWDGVVCNNQTGHVTELHLWSTYSLGGEISPSLLNLTYLHHLDLGGNYFNGTIPNFIGSMTQLRYLDLGYNYFTGTILKSIGSLTQLRGLDLSGNFLHGSIPLEFGNLTNLETLFLGDLERSRVEKLDWLFNLSHLHDLEMDGVSLAKANHWVDAILCLPKLTYLSLERCDLTQVMGPYSSFVNYSSSSIESLSFRDNNLNSSMYLWLFPLTSNRLLYLDLSYNMLDGVPKYLGNLCSLRSFFFNYNSASVNFTEFLKSLFGCTSVTLQELYASNSHFTGSFSNEIQQFSSLQTLDLSHNHLNGTMSEKVWELPNLQTLDVSSNSLVVRVKSENIGKSKLGYIDLSSITLEVIPSKARMLKVTYVMSLDMSICNLGPLFPKWIQTHKNLTYLDISDNRISDTIPDRFWKTWPSQLTYLNLSSNNISGEVPNLSSNFNFYPTIDLSSNNFYGPIPNVPSTLASLNLSKNKFYGGISFLCQIVDGSLSFLDLLHNSLIGQLPDCLWHFKQLRVLNLGHNNLFGRLPASLGHLVRLENCTGLNILNLGTNKFFGNVPLWIGENLTRLYGLILSSNNFSGHIPVQVCYLMNLQILDLSNNNLNGPIPTCVSNLTAMVDGSFLEENTHWYGVNIGSLGTYVDNVLIEWQGNEQEFTRTLGLLVSIDLSSSKLTGQIPKELTDLHDLLALNLSKNALHGEIPQKIGEMKKLLTLDLSRNSFSGEIPLSMSQIASLSYLDVSYNKLSGRIPSGTQLQSFEPSRYDGNTGLCGPPITESCSEDEEPSIVLESKSGEEDIDELQMWFYIGGGIGFATGFWMACGALLLNRRGRHAFFPFVDFVKDWAYVKMVVVSGKLEWVVAT